MASLHDLMARRHAVPALMRQFGDRGEDGDFQPIKYRPGIMPTVQDPFEWPAILSEIRYDPVPDAKGNITIRQTRTAMVETTLVLVDGITEFDIRSTFIVNENGIEEEWNFDQAASKWSGVFVTFGLVRKPLASKNELRSASV